EVQRELERRLDESVREVGRDRMQILLKRARDALPFSRLKSLWRGVDADLQASCRLHSHETALYIDLGGLHTPQSGLSPVLRQHHLVTGMQQIGADNSAMQLDFPRLQPVGYSSAL